MRIVLLAAAAVSFAAVPAMAQDLTSKAVAVRDEALANSSAWDIVESLTTEVGARPIGSPAMERARDWGVAKLQALGFETVHLEPFTTKAWSRGAESAELLDRMAARGKPVTVKLDMASTVNPAAQAWNVVGEIRGSAAPDEAIVIGGHLDSWDPGTGAIDFRALAASAK